MATTRKSIPTYPKIPAIETSGRDDNRIFKKPRITVPEFPSEQPKLSFRELDAKVVEQEVQIERLSERLSQIDANIVEILGRDSNLEI